MESLYYHNKNYANLSFIANNTLTYQNYLVCSSKADCLVIRTFNFVDIYVDMSIGTERNFSLFIGMLFIQKVLVLILAFLKHLILLIF